MQAATARPHRGGTRSLILAFALLGLLQGCAPRSGARAPVPDRADRPRLARGDDRQALSFHELAGSALTLEGGDQLFVSPVESSDLEVSAEQESRVLLAGVVGLAIGAGVGAVAGPEVFHTEGCSDGDWSVLSEGDARTLGAVVGGIVGAGLGVFIAMSSSAAIWSPVALAPLGVQAQASADGIGVRVSWTSAPPAKPRLP